MGNNKRIHDAAIFLLHRHLIGEQGAQLPADMRPTSIAEALAMQTQLSQLICTHTNDVVGGWKCLLPSPDKLVVAPIFKANIHEHRLSIDFLHALSMDQNIKIEPELAFRFVDDLPVRQTTYSQQDILAALGSAHIALELIYVYYHEPQQCHYFDMLADGLVNQGVYLGPQISLHDAQQASAITINIDFAQTKLQLKGKHPNILPMAPLVWLVNYLQSQGTPIVAGQTVITGSYAGVIDVPLNTDINITYLGLAAMQVHFLEKLKIKDTVSHNIG
jgi:2-keto-4-pentenoate hydratase